MGKASAPASALPPSAASSWWRDATRRWLGKWAAGTGRLPTASDSVELVQQRIYLLPTGRGLFLIVTAVLLLLVGINYQLSLAYVVAFLLAGLMQAALLASYRNLSGLLVRSGRSPRTRPGETLSFPVTVASPGRERGGIRLTAVLRGKRIDTGPLHAAAEAVVPAPLALAIPAQDGVRGVVPLGRITVESRAPYGLVRAWSYVHFAWIGIVEPAPESPAPPLPLRGGDEGQQARGRAHAAHDPDSLREYVAGDSLKRVAWKQLAKSGRWYTRTGDSGVRQEIDLDWQATQLADTEARLARMAAWVGRADNEGCAYTLSLPNGRLDLAAGAQQYADALLLLAIYPKKPEDLGGLR